MRWLILAISSGSTLFDIQSFNFTYKLLLKRYFFKKEKQTTNVVWNLAPKELMKLRMLNIRWIVSLDRNGGKSTTCISSPKPLKCQENLHLKMLSVYVVCWILLQTFQICFCIQALTWTLIRLLLEEHSDLGPHFLQKWLLKSQGDDRQTPIVVIGS